MSNCLYTLAHVQHSCLKSACVTRLPTDYLNENLTHPAGKLDSEYKKCTGSSHRMAQATVAISEN